MATYSKRKYYSEIKAKYKKFSLKKYSNFKRGLSKSCSKQKTCWASLNQLEIIAHQLRKTRNVKT
jgi:hypothetical protein